MNLYTRFYRWRWVGHDESIECDSWNYVHWMQRCWFGFRADLKYDIEHGRFPIGFLRRYAFIDGFFYSPLRLWKILRKYGWHSGIWRYSWMWRALSWPVFLFALLVVAACLT